MKQYSPSIPAVLVKTQQHTGSADLSNDGVASEIKLPANTSSCFILYPELFKQSEENFGCEVSTCTVDDAGRDTRLVFQTTTDRKFTNLYKLPPGHSTTLKIFTACESFTPKDLRFDSKLDSFITMVYSQNQCIKNKKLWTPAVEYVPGKTIWNGGPCQLVCRSKEYEKIQKIHYHTISEIYPRVYIFHLDWELTNVDIIWNTLPVEKEIDFYNYLDNVVVQPLSFIVVKRVCCWVNAFPKHNVIDDEWQHFKSRAPHGVFRHINERCISYSSEDEVEPSRKRCKGNIKDEIVGE